MPRELKGITLPRCGITARSGRRRRCRSAQRAGERGARQVLALSRRTQARAEDAPSPGVVLVQALAKGVGATWAAVEICTEMLSG